MVVMRTIWVMVLALVSLPVFGADCKLTVQVNSADTGKAIDRASVVINFKHGLNVNMKKIVTNWETKTNQEGKVTLPTMPQGTITVQVIARNYQTAGDTYELTEKDQTINIKLKRPQAQYSEDSKSKSIK